MTVPYNDETTSVVQLSEIYHQRCIDLAKSLVLKSHRTADAMNQEVAYHAAQLRTVSPINIDDPSSWRYYKHLRGEYHEIDRLMTVRSLDTLQRIDFTRENMKLHRATWAHYNARGEFYWDLVREFPDQHILIDGICHPIDFNTAYNAEEYTILAYDQDLVEDNELSLIPDLEYQIKRYMKRFDCAGYALHDPLFEPYRLGVLASLLPSMIVAIRENYVKSMQANSYHVWNYLASYFDLAKFKPWLTREQAMWLYMNIRYIDIHGGKQETFAELIEWLMTKRNIPLYRYEVGHKNFSPQTGLSKPDVKKKQINLLHLKYPEENDLTLKDIHDKERELGLRNIEMEEQSLEKSMAVYERSTNNNVQTKMLETFVRDYSNQEVYPRLNIGLEYWIYLAFTHRYPVIGTITNPKSGELLNMTSQEGFIVWLYCTTCLINPEDRPYAVEQMIIPELMVYDIYFEEMDWESVVGDIINYQVNIDIGLQTMIENYPRTKPIFSNLAFRDWVDQVYAYRNLQRHCWSFYEDLAVYGEIKQLAYRTMFRRRMKLTERPTTFAAYFDARKWDFGGLNREQLFNVATQIHSFFTGGHTKDTHQADFTQKAMIAIMKRLSSYTIQFTSDINAQDVRVLDTPFARYGHIRAIDIVKYESRICSVYQNPRGQTRHIHCLGILYGEYNTRVYAKELDDLDLNMHVKYHSTGYYETKVHGRLGAVGYQIKETTPPEIPKHYYYTFNGTLYGWTNQDYLRQQEIESSEASTGIPVEPDVRDDGRPAGSA